MNTILEFSITDAEGRLSFVHDEFGEVGGDNVKNS